MVEMQFGKDGAWTRLEQTKTIDPECLRMHQQNEFLNEEVFGWKMDYPSETTHMWKGVLPANPAVGTHLDHVLFQGRAGVYCERQTRQYLCPLDAVRMEIKRHPDDEYRLL